MVQKIKFIVWVFIIILAMPSQALVYQCVKPEGGFEFRDSPCLEITAQGHGFLPITYHKTQQETLNTDLKHQEKISAFTKKQQEIALRKEERLKAKQTKQALQQAHQEKRRIEKMQKLSEKIQTIEAELKAGCKLKRHNRLQKELKDCQDRQKGLRTFKSR